ncbi:MAG: hypothetical protein HY791_12740 [Deltaproteobacteria bacterium]|nr:hypothetical protein [Deltaproteobacteria bacterium]
MSLLLGVDGGGTKTVAALATFEGQLVGVARTGPSNPQSIGTLGAARAVRLAIDAALARAGGTESEIVASAFGIAGADFERGTALVARTIRGVGSFGRTFVDNDSLLVLRLGAPDFVGVGLVAGTGTNCVGRGSSGQRFQIGGMGHISGDLGSASDLATLAVREAWRQSDGRSNPTPLRARVRDVFGTNDLEAIAAAWEEDATLVPRLVSVLFECARAEDGAALEILDFVGAQLAEAATTCARGLGLDRPTIALGGSMLATEGHEPLRRVVRRRICAALERAAVCGPSEHPVVGALLIAADLMGATGFEAKARSAARGMDFSKSVQAEE